MQISRRRSIPVILSAALAMCLVMGSPGVVRAGEAESSGFRFVDGEGYRELLFGQTPIYRYVTRYDPADHANTFKPFHHVYGLHGEGFLTKGPGGWFTHHRGIFFGFKTPYGDFWHCPDVSQRHVKFLPERQSITPDAARDASVTEWIDKDGKAVVRDTREVTVHRADGEITLDFDITVESLTGGDIALGGDPHHAGFHFRAAQEVTGHPADTKAQMTGNATFILPAGAAEGKNATVTGADWVGCRFSIKGNPYIVVHMDSPDNPRPITYSTRPYGRFGSFAPMTVKADAPLKLRYRILILDGKTHADLSASDLAARYDAFCKSAR